MIPICFSAVVACFIEAYAPPAKYDYEPTAPYVVIDLPADELQERCWITPGTGWTWGCVHHGVVSKILIDKSLTGQAREIILAHEKAHINGWRH